jgi:mono/diheme cytochrome c family protein
MKKLLIVFTATVILISFSNCHSSKKAVAAIPKSTYDVDMTALITTHCSPCHIPAKGGKKKAYDNYANVKEDIDNIIQRIELEPGGRGFMPFKQAKLSDGAITAVKKWKADGMLEK